MSSVRFCITWKARAGLTVLNTRSEVTLPASSADTETWALSSVCDSSRMHGIEASLAEMSSSREKTARTRDLT